MKQLESLLDRGLLDGVVAFAIERYLIYPNRASTHIGDDLYTAQEIGRLKWIAFLRDVRVIERPASMAKQRWPLKRLQKYLPRVPRSPHMRDAVRHALTYIEVPK